MIPCQNKENHENLSIPLENNENNEIHIFLSQNHKNLKKKKQFKA